MAEDDREATVAADDPGVEFVVLGGPEEGPTLGLDHRRFAYAGKFVMSTTGKAVAREVGREAGMAEELETGYEDRAGERTRASDGEVVAAAAFDRDRTDPSVVRIRYVTVRRDRRAEGLGARLLAFLAARLLGDARTVESGRVGGPPAIDGVREVRIAVNNPFAYEAAYKAGFCYTGERTGLAELLVARPGDRSTSAYRRGLEAFDAREDLESAERAFLDARRGSAPPPTVQPLEDCA